MNGRRFRMREDTEMHLVDTYNSIKKSKSAMFIISL